MKQKFRKMLCVMYAAVFAMTAVPDSFTAFSLINVDSYTRMYDEPTDTYYNVTSKVDSTGKMYEERIEAEYMGDVDRDGQWAYIDAAMIVEMLLGQGEKLTEDFPRRIFKPEAADMNGDGMINAVDLTLMKRKILSPPEMDPVEAGVWPPLNPNGFEQTESTGVQRMLVLVADFADFYRKDNLTAEQIHDQLFGPEDKSSAAYPYESVSAFYSRASYGRLELTGDVYTFKSEKKLKEYYEEQSDGTVRKDLDAIIKDAVEALDIDVTKYCSSERIDPVTGTQMLDAVALIVPKSAIILYMDTASHSLSQEDDIVPDWNPAYSMNRRTVIAEKDGKCYTAKIMSGAIDLSDQKNANQTLLHEFGHSIGLDDLYNRPFYDDSLACTEPMNNNNGDFAGVSKLCLGWLNYDEVQYYAGGTQTFTLESSALKPDILVISTMPLREWHSNNLQTAYPTEIRIPAFHFRGDLRTIVSDTLSTFNSYFLVELVTPDANMTGIVEQPGVRIMNGNGTMAMMRPVGRDHGFFVKGDVIDKNTKDFVQTGSQQSQLITEEMSITVDDIKDGKATVTVSGQEYIRAYPFYEGLNGF